MRLSCSALGMIALVAACASEPRTSVEAPQSTDADRKAIETVRKQELATFSAGDIEAFTEILTDDVVFDPPNRPAATGKDAIRAYGAIFERFVIEATYAVDELVIDGGWAFDRGVWIERRTARDTGDQTEVPFGLVQIYQRQADGSWKIARMIWNTDSPPAHSSTDDAK